MISLSTTQRFLSIRRAILKFYLSHNHIHGVSLVNRLAGAKTATGISHVSLRNAHGIDSPSNNSKCNQSTESTDGGRSCRLFFPYNDTSLNSKTLVPHQGGSVVNASNSWPGGCEFHTRFKRTSFPAYFHISPLLKHLRKVVGVAEMKVVLVLLWENMDTHQETHVHHRPLWYDLSC